MDNQPFGIGLGHYLWPAILASWGGLVHYIQRSRRSRYFSIVELIGELVTSAFAGIITYMVSLHLHMDPIPAAALAGIAGHMGSRSLFLLENKWLNRMTEREPAAENEKADPLGEKG